MEGTTRLTQRSSRRIEKILIPWGMFLLFFLWGWRVGDVFDSIPAYGDALEVIWGTLWYYNALFVKHTSPLFTSMIFHPEGWYTATLAHTPTFFLLAALLCWVGGVAFAYNLLCILSLLLVFAGSFRFARLYTEWVAATAAALIFTFMGFRWFRANGHLHILWASSLLPWFLWGLEKVRRSSPVRKCTKFVWFTGLSWGAMINFSLYSLFLGTVAFGLWGRQLAHPRRIKQGLSITAIALLVSSPVIVFTGIGLRAGQASSNLHELIYWESSLNALVIPSLNHPLALIRDYAQIIYSGPVDESGLANLGTVTFVLGAIGLVLIVKRGRQFVSLVWIPAIALILSLGIYLKWNGTIVSSSVFRPVNNLIWTVGHLLKPALFTSKLAPPMFQNGVPLPGLVLAAVVPYSEAARVAGRYALVGGLGLIVLAAYGLCHLPQLLRYFLIVVWMVEVLPRPIAGRPIPLQPHPAYSWLAEQNLDEGYGILDLEYPLTLARGSFLLATWFHHTPSVSGAGSYLPAPAAFLAHTLNTYYQNPLKLSTTDLGLILEPYRVRYVFVHLKGSEEQRMWDALAASTAFRPVRCFDPLRGDSPWPYPICVAEVAKPPLQINLIRRDGWSVDEEWGVWATGNESQATWVATSNANQRLGIEAFPNCLPERQQEVSIEVNGHPLAMHPWEGCETWRDTLLIPGTYVNIGWNTLTFRYAYTAPPVVDGPGGGNDLRPLAVGFTRLEIEEVTN